jgi:nucleotide-binding universal stress UspA family protein
MIEEKKTILVTWDFSEVSVNAFKYALNIAKVVESDIQLLNIVKPNEPEILKSAEEKLSKEAAILKEKYKWDISSLVLEGSIFTAISNYAKKDAVHMVVMGTHGIKGMQKYFGSFALRVMVGSEVPFIVIQGKAALLERFSNIVFPVDFKSENKEKLQWAIFLCKYFNSKVLLYKMPVKDKSLVKKMNTNLNFAVRFLIQNNIEFEIHTASGKGNFGKQSLDFARESKADLILITTTKHITIFDYLFGAPEQYIIANASGIPVMCVNPRASFIKVGQFMYGST